MPFDCTFFPFLSILTSRQHHYNQPRLNSYHLSYLPQTTQQISPLLKTNTMPNKNVPMIRPLLMIFLFVLALSFIMHSRNTIVETLAVIFTPFFVAMIYLLIGVVFVIIMTGAYSAARSNRRPHSYAFALGNRRGRVSGRRRYVW